VFIINLYVKGNTFVSNNQNIFQLFFPPLKNKNWFSASYWNSGN